ncbi:MAG: hypothetical protein ACRD2L_20845 [Terriglobia bacterium]
MNIVARLILPQTVYKPLVAHLLPAEARSEEVAFVFARFEEGTFEFLEWYPVPTTEFEYRSLYHIELSVRCRAKTIKRAHDLGCSIMEFHSHPCSQIPSFSPSDYYGFHEYVPHVSWRLKGKPYAAIVVAAAGFDSLVWLGDPQRPAGTVEIAVGNKVLHPSGSTLETGVWPDANEI